MAIVTAGGSGIGKATCVMLALSGYIPARPTGPRQIAAAIAVLTSRQASYVTGASFVVDGGHLMMAAASNQRRS